MQVAARSSLSRHQGVARVLMGDGAGTRPVNIERFARRNRAGPAPLLKLMAMGWRRERYLKQTDGFHEASGGESDYDDALVLTYIIRNA